MLLSQAKTNFEATAIWDRSTWTPPAVFAVIAGHGVERAEMERTFNMGMGMVAIVDATAAGDAMARLRDRGVPSWPCCVVRDRRDGEAGDVEAKGGGGGDPLILGEGSDRAHDLLV